MSNQNLLSFFLILSSVASCEIQAQVLPVDGVSLERNREGVVTGLTYYGQGTEPATGLTKHRESLHHVKSAILEQHRITPQELGLIVDLPSLERLVLGTHPVGITISQPAISQVAKCRSLKWLEAHLDNCEIDDWTFLSAVTSLESLSLTGCVSLSNVDLVAISSLPRLRHLVISGKLEGKDFDWLGELGQLEELDIECDGVSQAILRDLGKLTHLRKLRMVGVKFTNQQLRRLVESAMALESLEVHFDKSCEIDSFRMLPKLKSLVVVSRYINEHDLAFVNQLPALESICVRCSLRNYNAGRELCGHPSLKTVLVTNLEGTKVLSFLDCQKKITGRRLNRAN